MTALKEVLIAEQEAEQAIINAKNEVAADIDVAQTRGQKKKAFQEEEQKKVEIEAINNHKEKIAQKINTIDLEAQAEIAVVEKHFSAKHNEVKDLLIEQL